MDTIFICNKSCTVKEVGGKRKFYMFYNYDEIPPLHMEVLKNNPCRKLIKMDFMEEDNKIKVYYDINNFVVFDNVINKTQKNISKLIIRILTSLIECMTDMENHLLSPNEYLLDLEALFLNPSNEDVRLAYVPNINGISSAQRGLVQLISDTVKRVNDDQWEAYANKIIDEINYYNYGLYDIRNQLIEKSREIYEREWPVNEVGRELDEIKMEDSGHKEIKINKLFKFK